MGQGKGYPLSTTNLLLCGKAICDTEASWIEESDGQGAL